MVPVKIECDCGQHYAFDVEPVNGRMSFPVACPTCGVDGTAAANEIIAGALALSASAPPPPPPIPVRAPVPPADVPVAPQSARPGLHLNSPAHSYAPAAAGAPMAVMEESQPVPAAAKIPKMGTYSADQLGLVSKEQAAVEAKAKVLWGEGHDSVIKYLMMQSYTYQEAADLVGVLFKERLADLRKKGTGKIIQGIGMICVPVVGYFLNMMMISFILMGIMAMVGVFGFYLLITGTVMVVAPKSETGDVAED